METSAEACWRLSKACGQWAVESRDSAARIAFRQMATAWARLAFNEEFTSPVVFIVRNGHPLGLLLGGRIIRQVRLHDTALVQ